MKSPFVVVDLEVVEAWVEEQFFSSSGQFSIPSHQNLFSRHVFEVGHSFVPKHFNQTS